MKRIIIVMVLSAFTVANLLAQEGEIIVRDFGEAGLTHVFDEKLFFLIDEGESERWYLDLDYDGEGDFYYMGVMIRDAPWECHNYVVTDFQVDNTSPLRLAYDLQIGDTLSAPDINWKRIHLFPDPREFYEDPSLVPEYFAVRFPKDDGFCYGWLKQKFEYIGTIVDTSYMSGACLDESHITVYRMAYCTIPNYPLRLGQTSFDWSIEEIEEDEANAFATLHPNPTTGQITVAGENLRQAEVVNTLGQRVATVKGEGELLTVDISGLPVGIYFVNIANGEGRKYVRKVVKE